MQNAFAVYSPKGSLNGGKLATLAAAAGVHLRFMAMGGYIPSDPDEIQSKPLATVNGGGLLVVGAFEAHLNILGTFDKLIANSDRNPLAAMLNSFKLPWIELHTRKFDYVKWNTAKPKDKTNIDGSVAKERLSEVKAAKTRYIVHNQSRRKNCNVLMKALTDIIAAETCGVVADFKRPS